VVTCVLTVQFPVQVVFGRGFFMAWSAQCIEPLLPDHSRVNCIFYRYWRTAIGQFASAMFSLCLSASSWVITGSATLVARHGA
jgi:hypothetical protein